MKVNIDAIDALSLLFASEDRGHRCRRQPGGLVRIYWEYGQFDDVPTVDVARAVQYWFDDGRDDDRNGWSRFFDLLTDSLASKWGEV